MDPYNEQRLRDEVIYLHSLWNQGPPNRTNPNPTTIRPRPPTTRRPDPQFPNPTPSKRKTRDETEPPINRNNKKPSSSSQFDPDPRWQSPTPAQPDSSGWPSPSPPKLDLSPAPPPEEQARYCAVHLHNRAVEAYMDLFSVGLGSGSDIEEDEDEKFDDDDEEYKLMVSLFAEKSELRSYYEANWEHGDFYCLVCGGLGKKKRTKGCAGLVQHSIDVSKTKKKRAHRALAQAVCRVLGWDFGRLPTIVLNGEMLGVSLAKTGDETEVEAVEDNVGAEMSDNAELSEKEAADEDPRKSQDSMRDENANQFEHKEQAGDMQNEPEVKVDFLNNVALEVGVVVHNEHHLSENDAPTEPCEKEAFDDHQCGHTEPCGKEAFRILKCAQVLSNSLKEDAPDQGTESLDEEKRTSIEGAVQEEAKDASVEISAESCEDGLSGVKDSVAVEIDANAKLAENTAFDDHQKSSGHLLNCQVVLFIDPLKDDSPDENTESIGTEISDVRPNKENALYTGERDDGLNENTGSLDKEISEVEAEKEDAVDTRVEVEDNADDLALPKVNLDTLTASNFAIGSKEEPGVTLSKGPPMACELQSHCNSGHTFNIHQCHKCHQCSLDFRRQITRHGDKECELCQHWRIHF